VTHVAEGGPGMLVAGGRPGTLLVAAEPEVDVVEVLRGTSTGPLTAAAGLTGALAAAATVVLVAALLVGPERTTARGPVTLRLLWLLAAVTTMAELALLLVDGGSVSDRRPVAALARLLLLTAGAGAADRLTRPVRLLAGSLVLLTVPLGLPRVGTPGALLAAVAATAAATAVVAALLRVGSERPRVVLASALAAIAVLTGTLAWFGTAAELPPYHLERVQAGAIALDVTVAPVQPGRNELHVYAWHPDGREAALDAASAEVVGRPDTRHDLFAVTANHHLSYVLELPADGPWELALTGVTDDGEELHATVRLEAP
jgi:hypothetical protein